MDKIYLQTNHEPVTWCEHRVNDDDIEYVLSEDMIAFLDEVINWLSIGYTSNDERTKFLRRLKRLRGNFGVEAGE